jgi:RimJ/RimL family protein N-acetyltransferase
MQRPADIQTERLILRVILPDEIEWLLAGEAHRLELANGLTYPPDDPNRGIDLGWHLRALRADARQLPWRIRLIVERSSNIVVGSINLKGAPDAEGDVEIGWGLNLGHRGKGYATEAATAVMRWAFEQPGVRSISATVPEDNDVSQRVARRLGFTRTASTRRNLPLWKVDALRLSLAIDRGASDKSIEV